MREAASAAEALELAREADFDVVLTDVRMPGRSGIELIGELRRLRPETPAIVMTAFGSIDSAVEAMRAGAFDYIAKPFEPEVVMFAVDRALQQRALEDENRRLRRAVDRTSAFGDLIGTSPAMQEIFALIRKIAHGRSSVLITGESGTGKEVVARTLHFHGSRADKPFIPINCTAIPEGLLESELFGHVRGAFTGAHASKQGLFEKANGGTLFLDEIGDMGLGLQSKLLRVIQDREIRPVGGTQSVKVDVRIVAATNKDLAAEIEEGRFREDLFYRLNVIPLLHPAAARAPRGHPGARRPLRAQARRRHAPDGVARGHAAARGLRLEGQCPRARERDRAGARALRCSRARRRGPAARGGCAAARRASAPPTSCARPASVASRCARWRSATSRRSCGSRAATRCAPPASSASTARRSIGAPSAARARCETS